MFKIVSAVRRVETRLKRAKSATRHRFKQFVAGRRLLRKQSFLLTDEEAQKYMDELKAKSEAGVIHVLKDGEPYAFSDSPVAPVEPPEVQAEEKTKEKVEASAETQEEVVVEEEQEEAPVVKEEQPKKGLFGRKKKKG